MPRLLIWEDVPVRLVVVEFDPSQGEEIFLTYTHDFKNGPRIIRTGIGPPYMQRPRPRYPGEITAHPFGQRLGTWLIQENLRDCGNRPNCNRNPKCDFHQAEDQLSKAVAGRASSDVITLLQDYLDEVPAIPAHDREFINVYSDYEIIGQQGCGDLTMNLWYVAYINSPLARPSPALIHLFEEPVESRTYSCLVKWLSERDPNKVPRYELTIEDVRFTTLAKQPNDMVFTWDGNHWAPRGDDIEFAVYGKQVIRDGQVVNLSRITHEFSDLRHLVQMPNINPDTPLFNGDPGRPRFYFGRMQHADVWFGEAQLLDDTNLQRAACAGPIFLSRLYRGMGASVEQIRGAMQIAGYREVTNPRQPLGVGEYRFVPEDDTLVEVYLKRNTYGWTMIGLSRENDKILCLACEGVPGVTGHILENAANKLICAGAYNGLLIDEGADVFQMALLGLSGPKAKVAGGGPDLDITVPLKRTRLRATFIFARRKQ